MTIESRERWSRPSVLIGSVAMLVGAVDPMEGSLLILPGSGLVALGAWIGRSERRLVLYRLWTFILIAIGVGALWGFSSVGGFGGPQGYSMWWGVLILPYLIGWLMPLWGPGAPRWYLWLGNLIGLWYLAFGVFVLAQHDPASNAPDTWIWALIILGVMGALTIAGCVRGLRRRTSRESPDDGGPSPVGRQIP